MGAGHRFVAGIDEVGRGAWAGPVVAAAVIFDDASPAMVRRLHGVNDSKLLTHQQRVRFDLKIRQHAVAIGIGSVCQHVIDEINILNATKLAMAIAVSRLPVAPEYLLIDALRLADLALPQKPIIHGDTLSLSIAAASIVAKVHRDRIMTGYASQFPAYRFATNKGYGTMAHFEALHHHGLLGLHRRSFIPMRYILARDLVALTTYRKMIRLLAMQRSAAALDVAGDLDQGDAQSFQHELPPFLTAPAATSPAPEPSLLGRY